MTSLDDEVRGMVFGLVADLHDASAAARAESGLLQKKLEEIEERLEELEQCLEGLDQRRLEEIERCLRELDQRTGQVHAILVNWHARLRRARHPLRRGQVS